MTLWLFHLCSSKHKRRKWKQKTTTTKHIKVCWRYNGTFFFNIVQLLCAIWTQKTMNDTEYWQKLKLRCLHRKPCNNINSLKEKYRTENGRKYETITGMCIAFVLYIIFWYYLVLHVLVKIMTKWFSYTHEKKEKCVYVCMRVCVCVFWGEDTETRQNEKHKREL